MPKPSYKNSPAAYEDVRKVLDIALEKPGLVLECNTRGAAINFRQRCYKYRGLLRELEYERLGSTPGFPVSVAYDILKIEFINQAEGSRESRFLRFSHQTEFVGKLIDPETGKELDVEERMELRLGLEEEE